MDEVELDGLATNTLGLLESRLKRLEFILAGETALSEQATNQTIVERLLKLEQNLAKLGKNNKGVGDWLTLCMCATPYIAPSLSIIDSSHPQAFNWITRDNLPDLEFKEKATSVLAAAPSLQTTASQLRALADTKLPSTAGFTTWTSLLPRIHAIVEEQDEQDQQLSELRKRSAILVTRWHEIQVQAQMRCWIEYEGRVRKAERQIRKQQLQKLADDG